MTSIESTPAAPAPRSKAEPAKSRPAGSGGSPPRRALIILADAGLIVLFLALTFLLGVFPLKDTDIFWHLRTGQIIRETGQVPRTDLFTFTREGVAWFDLHWIFQVAVSWLYERDGAVALNLAKCGVTCLAVLILVTNRRRGWPIWVALAAWLPALLVLGGRMYVRPETLSLLYLSIFLAVLTRWDRRPYLVAILPIVQVAWVNSHGLFVLGPIVLGMALVDAAVREPWRRAGARWWKVVGGGSLATFAACLLNPYGLRGAIFPIELAGTMSNAIFSLNIAELTPIPEFIRRHGTDNLSLQLHFLTMALGALSFLVPLIWSIGVPFSGEPDAEVPAPASGPEKVTSRTSARRKDRADARTKTSGKKASGRSSAPADPVLEPAMSWRLSPFRLLLFFAFSFLSLQATRNSHQFAAVVGSVTAWNLAEWAAAVRKRRIARMGPDPAPPGARSGLLPRLVTAVGILTVLAWVGSGLFYKMTGEGRTIGMGEQPVFFAHEAARFAGRPEMPERFLSFHNGHASLFLYYNGPGRKVFTDPRLEIAGADLFEEYVDLGRSIRQNNRELKPNQPRWQDKLDRIGRPVVMVDHEYNWAECATMLASEHWRCVWFDPIVAVFVHDTAEEAVRQHLVDFAARHFRHDASGRGRTPAERAALAKAFRNLVGALPSHRTDLVRPLVWLGLDDCREILADDPNSLLAWKMLGQVEISRDPRPAPPPSPRYRLPFDPVADLSLVRATYAMLRALEIDPADITTNVMIEDAYARRGMHEEALKAIERLTTIAARHPNPSVLMLAEEAAAKRAQYLREIGSSVPGDWRNMAELDRMVTALLASGQARAAADALEKAYPAERAPWDVLNRMATLRLHLGEPEKAGACWQRGMGEAPEPAVAAARIAATYLAQEDFDAARKAYRRALGAMPALFEACYGLAVLEADAGDAATAAEMARKAVATAPDDRSRDAAESLVKAVESFAGPR